MYMYDVLLCHTHIVRVLQVSHHSNEVAFDQGVLFSSHCLDRHLPYMLSLWEDVFTESVLLSIEENFSLSSLLPFLPPFHPVPLPFLSSFLKIVHFCSHVPFPFHYTFHSHSIPTLSSHSCSPNLADLERLKTLVKMAASGMAASVANTGHSFAVSASASRLSPAAELSELLGGLSQVRHECGTVYVH